MAHIAIYGAGGSAREVAWLVEATGNHQPICFIDDDETRWKESINGIPVMSLNRARLQYPDAKVVGGIGASRIRQRVIKKAMRAGFAFETIIHPRVERSRWITIGDGTVICAGCIITTNITIGAHVQINLDCTICHDSILEDYVTLAPGVHVSGCVKIEEGAYIGTGASIINGSRDQFIVIGRDAIIGAQACVTRSVDAGATVVGVPAKLLQR